MLFRRSPEKRAREAGVQAEVDRLTALSPEALAAKVLPILAEAAKSTVGGVTVREICKELLGTVSGRANLALNLPVGEALQRLEHANLVLQMAGAQTAPSWRITEEGEGTLEAGNIADKLGLHTG